MSCFYTAIASEVWPHLNQMAGAARAMPLYHEMVGWTVDHFYREAVYVIEMLGSAGRASTL